MAVRTMGRVPYSDSVKWEGYYEGNSEFVRARGKTVEGLRENMLRFVEDVLDIPVGCITEENLGQLRHLLRYSRADDGGWLPSVELNGAYVHARVDDDTGLVRVSVDTEEYYPRTAGRAVPYMFITLNEGDLWSPAKADEIDPTTAGEVLRNAMEAL